MEDSSSSSSSSVEDAFSIPSSAEELGRPLPLDEHACSVSLPTWSSVVGYEEGIPEVTSKMSCGYPRFVYHPYIIQLMEYAVDRYGKEDGQEMDCLVLPTPEAAMRCQAFLQESLSKRKGPDNALIGTDANDTNNSNDNSNNNNDASKIRRVSLAANVEAVLFPAETLAGMEAKAYWQHTGEIVSSRRAEVAIQQLGLEIHNKVTPPYMAATKDSATASSSELICHQAHEQCGSVIPKLKGRIADLAGVPSSHVHLTASGMCSIYVALQSSRRCRMMQQQQQQQGNGGASIVFGFPYLDTLKLCSRSEFCPGGVEFFGNGNDTDLHKLEQMLNRSADQSQQWCALFTEVPSNPLLQTPNLGRLRELANQHNFALVVDDTIGNFCNVDLMGPDGADVVCTSLTKLFSGRGDAMAGSLVVNPDTKQGQEIQEDLEKHQNNSVSLFESDAWAVYHNSVDFVQRNEQINETAEELSDWLRQQPEIGRVYYPKYSSRYYHEVATGRGYGGLLSLLLEPHVCQRTFFDALDIAKGPSLGTNFTLMCPYTLLAHYHELDFAMTYNVQPNLLRLSVGMEDLSTLKEKFEHAFCASRLHPPLPKGTGNVRMHHTWTTARNNHHQATTATTTTTTTRRALRAGFHFMTRRLVR